MKRGEVRMQKDIQYIKTDRLIPHPLNNKYFNDLPENEYTELLLSINQDGILTPLMVNKLDEETYRIVCGHQRHRVAHDLGLSEVPCIICDYNESEEVSVLIQDNIFRRQITHVEKLRAINALRKLGSTNLIESLFTSKRSMQTLTSVSSSMLEDLASVIPSETSVKTMVDLSKLPDVSQRELAAIISSLKIQDEASLDEAYKKVITQLEGTIERQKKTIDRYKYVTPTDHIHTQNAKIEQDNRACYDDVIRSLISINTQIISFFRLLSIHKIDPKGLGFHDFNASIDEFKELPLNYIPPIAPIFRLINIKALKDQLVITDVSDVEEAVTNQIEEYLVRLFGTRT